MRCGPSLEVSRGIEYRTARYSPDKASRISCQRPRLMRMALAICSSRMRGAAGVGQGMGILEGREHKVQLLLGPCLPRATSAAGADGC